MWLFFPLMHTGPQLEQQPGVTAQPPAEERFQALLNLTCLDKPYCSLFSLNSHRLATLHQHPNPSS